MSLSLASATLFVADHLTIIRVQSLKCHYRVAVEDEKLTIYGPGVEEELEYGEEGHAFLLLFDPEARAIAAVLLFEEG
jgi:hypothetical protein